MVFQSVVAQWPGSCHDSFVLQQSGIYNKFESGLISNGILLGDSGYPLKTWLMTPISRPVNPAEETYNVAHQKTRVVIEK